jgi:hypothetical protein
MEWGKVRELTFEHCHKLAGQIVELEKEMKRLKELPIIGKIAGDRHTELRKMMVDHSQLLSSLGWSGKYQDYLRNYQEYFG